MVVRFGIKTPGEKLTLDQGREHRRRYFVNKVSLSVFDVYDFRITRAETAQFAAYRSGLVLVVEYLAPLVIG
ncbi:MAG: hypothetical protein JO212_18105, partial [Acetobacteraceae bacterium]|nr:hypothetical protein [Acetobacteraceae bacterium]